MVRCHSPYLEQGQHPNSSPSPSLNPSPSRMLFCYVIRCFIALSPSVSPPPPASLPGPQPPLAGRASTSWQSTYYSLISLLLIACRLLLPTCCLPPTTYLPPIFSVRSLIVCANQRTTRRFRVFRCLLSHALVCKGPAFRCTYSVAGAAARAA